METSITRFFLLLFLLFLQLFLSYLWINHPEIWWKFGLPLMIIYKFCKRHFSLQPPGDPREQHPGDARQRTYLWIFFLCKSILDNNLGDLWVRKFHSYHQEPKDQHQGEGAQEILWQNLLSSISQPLMDQSSYFFVSISHFWLFVSFKETFLSNH